MNNATFFNGQNGRFTIREAFSRYCDKKQISMDRANYDTALRFAAAPAMQVLQFSIGQIVQFDFNALTNLYGTVESYHPNALDLDNGPDATAPHIIYVKAQNGTTYGIQDCGRNLRKPEFPQGLVELVRNQLQTSCPANIKEKCPFKDEYKEPVPPCMKEGTND